MSRADLYQLLELQLAELRADRLRAACYPDSPVNVSKHVKNIMDTLAQIEKRP